VKYSHSKIEQQTETMCNENKELWAMVFPHDERKFAEAMQLMARKLTARN
jgi:hypothetical protein